jgi:3-oxoacyl-(acyl-carrier-protein) synthase
VKVQIEGIGCVTPLGRSVGEIARRAAAGDRAPVTELSNPETGGILPAALVPPEFTAHLSRERRLRRASTISLLAAAAGKAAIADCGIDFTADAKPGLALVLGVSSGGVHYTRRFYEQVVKQGASSASPLLFPETVYNAPASHLAAMLGIDGATYTLVGDCTVGLQALHFAAQLIETGEAQHVLVVAAEELDWILIEAHRTWRLIAPKGRALSHMRPHTGALLAEGAAAVVIGCEGRRAAVHMRDGCTCFSKREAPAVMDRVLAGLSEFAPVDLIVSGGNGTWADDVIEAAVARHFPNARQAILKPKDATGEILGAGALLQVLLAADALERTDSHRALVAAMGWNQQAAAAVIERPTSR